MNSNTLPRLEGGRRTCEEDHTQQPLVSIIIVVRNGREDIAKALASVFAQRNALYELIVIDGASTDGTVGILQDHNNDIDYWISEPDGGIYEAMNKAVKLVRGRYVYFLGCDDLLTVDLNVLNSILTDPNTIYYGNVRLPSQVIHGGPYNAWTLANGCICHQAILYPIAVFKVACFFTDYKLAADYALNLFCFGDKRFRFQYIPHVIADFSNKGRSSLGPDTAFERDRMRLIRKHLPIYVYVAYIPIRVLKLLIKRYRGQSKAHP